MGSCSLGVALETPSTIRAFLIASLGRLSLKFSSKLELHLLTNFVFVLAAVSAAMMLLHGPQVSTAAETTVGKVDGSVIPSGRDLERVELSLHSG